MVWVRFHHCGWLTANEHFRISNHCWAMYLRILRAMWSLAKASPTTNASRSRMRAETCRRHVDTLDIVGEDGNDKRRSSLRSIVSQSDSPQHVAYLSPTGEYPRGGFERGDLVNVF